MTRILFLLLLALLWVQPASANLATVGHTAPATGPILIEIDGSTLAGGPLAYAEFREFDLAPGLHQVRILDAASGQPLLPARSWSGWVHNPSWLVLTGGGADARPLQVASNSPPELSSDRFSVIMVNVAVDQLNFQRRCAGTAGGSIAFGFFGMGSSPGNDCTLSSSAVNAGRVDALQPIRFQLDQDPGRRLFVFYLGDGSSSAPFQWLLVRNGMATTPQEQALADQLRTLKSTRYWYDNGRFSQGITLYEVSRTLAVHGIWNTYASDGRPRWLYVDGGVVDPSGRRELVLFDYVLEQGQRKGSAVGRGTLTYLDCNNAELQVRFADGSSRAALFKRSIEVSQCAAVP